MRVHALTFAKETGIRIEHVVAAGHELGFTSIREAIVSARDLKLPQELVSGFEAQVEQQREQAHRAAVDMLTEELYRIKTFEELEQFYADNMIINREDKLERLYLARRIELITTILHAQTSRVYERTPGHEELEQIRLEKWERLAHEASRKARTFRQAWSAYGQCPRDDSPSATLALDKVKRLAKSKEQLLEVCEHFKPYDPRDDDFPEDAVDPEPLSETYLFFVRKLAALYPLEATTKKPA